MILLILGLLIAPSFSVDKCDYRQWLIEDVEDMAIDGEPILSTGCLERIKPTNDEYWIRVGLWTGRYKNCKSKECPAYQLFLKDGEPHGFFILWALNRELIFYKFFDNDKTMPE